jgi:hypothetical protein
VTGRAPSRACSPRGGAISGTVAAVAAMAAALMFAAPVPAEPGRDDAAVAVQAQATQAQPTQAQAIEAHAIEVHARTIDAFLPRDPERRRFGPLIFRGGLELTSSYGEFGGLSALRMAPDGEHFVSLSDKSYWLTGRIVYDGDRPVGIADAEMAPMLGPDGHTLAARGWYDTESLAEQDGVFYVGIERVNRIVRFDFAKNGVRARAAVVTTPPGIATLPNNKGLEALAFAPRSSKLAGTLIAFSERGLDAAGNLKAFLIGGPTPGEFTVKRRDDFDISDCTVLPSGDLLLLERRFVLLRGGIAMRLRRLALADIKPAAVVDGPVLFFADMGYQIDNMEGISTHRTAAGDLILTMVSDDNFSFLQRTILLQFKLVGE